MNGIDKTSPHYKGDYSDIYAVERKYPNGGTDGDFIVIEGWAHYWNSDRGTWCVNEKRDSYWDELITNIASAVSKIRGATYMGIAEPDTKPDATVEAKMFYFAKTAGMYPNFGEDIILSNGITILYTNGDGWKADNLLRIDQCLGNNTSSVMSQKAVTDEINRIAALISDTPFALYIESSEGQFFTSSMIAETDERGNYLPFTTLSVKAYYHNQNVTGDIFNVKWTRQTKYPSDDEIWNKAHSNAVNDIPITLLDVGGEKYSISNVFFKCEAEYNNVYSEIQKASFVIKL